MNQAVISGDIIASTSLTDKGRDFISDSLSKLFSDLKKTHNIYGKMLKGDYVECVVPEPENALLVSLLIKSYIKSISDHEMLKSKPDKRFRLFKIYGIRLAIGYGELSRFDPEKGIIDGEAIYLSGRKINEEATYNKERIIIKNTLHFVSGNETLNQEFEPLLSLIDVLLAKATARQSEVLYYKLKNYTEKAIAKKIHIAQSAVNQHSTSIGWNAIEKAIRHFRQVIQKI